MQTLTSVTAGAETPITARPSDRALAVVFALIAFAVYGVGACRTIYVGDSGELVAAVSIGAGVRCECSRAISQGSAPVAEE